MLLPETKQLQAKWKFVYYLNPKVCKIVAQNLEKAAAQNRIILHTFGVQVWLVEWNYVFLGE